MINPNFWKNKRVLVTGHTGFKGGWISLWLQSLEVDLAGFALPPNTNPSLFEVANVSKSMQSFIGDIRSFDEVAKVFNSFKPEIVFHLAAQPLVRYSYNNPIETYATNVMGTVHVLEAARHTASVKAIVNVTSDKCYENKEWIWGYRENEPMGGYDPYSNSKGCAELVTSAYRSSYFSSPPNLALASARAGNVIGGGDWSEDRLVPDIIKSITSQQAVTLRNPSATRPWQHVLEPLSGYLMLAEQLYQAGNDYAQAWNFGPSEHDAKSVEWVAQALVKQWGEEASYNVSNQANTLHEAHLLKLDSSKARNQLKWKSKWDVDTTLKKITQWHKAHISGVSMREYCLDEITEYNNMQ